MRIGNLYNPSHISTNSSRIHFLPSLLCTSGLNKSHLRLGRAKSKQKLKKLATSRVARFRCRWTTMTKGEFLRQCHTTNACEMLTTTMSTRFWHTNHSSLKLKPCCCRHMWCAQIRALHPNKEQPEPPECRLSI